MIKWIWVVMVVMAVMGCEKQMVATAPEQLALRG